MNIVIDTRSFADGGRVTIDSKNDINIAGLIFSSAFGQFGKGGDILLNSVGDISLISSSLNVIGSEGGNISLNGNNINIVFSSLLSGIGQGLGFENAQGGDIQLNANENILVDNSVIGNILGLNSIGSIGNISIKADSFSLTNGGSLISSTLGIGDTGIIDINVEGAITIDGGNQETLSTIFNTVEAGGIGNSQNINISANTLSLTNGGQIQTVVNREFDNLPPGQGNAGDVNIEVLDAVIIDGIGFSADNNGSIVPIASQIRTNLDVGSKGKAGNINLKAGSFSLTNGGILSSSTAGIGDTGIIDINVEGAISIGNSNQRNASTIFNTVEAGGIGNSQNVNISANTLSLTNGSQILTLVRQGNPNLPPGQGKAGDVNIEVLDAVTIDGIGFH